MSLQFIDRKLVVGGIIYEARIRAITRRERKEFLAKGIDIMAPGESNYQIIADFIIEKCVEDQAALDECPAGIEAVIVRDVMELTFGISEASVKN